MFIDIHTHAYRIKPPVYGFSTPEELLQRYDNMKVDMAVILPVVSPEIYMPQSVEDVIEICQKAILAMPRHNCLQDLFP